MAEDTLLNYVLTTDQFPLQASSTEGSANIVKLTIVASNPNPETPITIKKLTVTIPKGPDATHLTDIQPPNPVPPADWTVSDPTKGNHLLQYVFKPDAGKGQVGRQGLAFIFNAIQVNTQPGTVKVTVEEGSPDEPMETLDVTKFPPDWGKVAFWADPPIVAAGGSTTLNWSGPARATYTIEYINQKGVVQHVPKQGDPPLSNQGRYPGQSQAPLKLDRNTVFYLNVVAVISGTKYEAQQHVPVSVESVKIRASGPDHPVNAKDEVEIKWTTSSAKTISIDVEPQQLDATSGEGKFLVHPTHDTTYNLTAVDANNNKKIATVAVHVNPAKIVSFKATPAAVRLGSEVALSWKTTSSASTSIQPGIGDVDPEGTKKLTPPSGVTAYTLNAQSQFPPAIETINVIATRPGFNQAVSNPVYAAVEAGLVIGNKFFMLDPWEALAWSSLDGLVWKDVVITQPCVKRMDGCAVVFDAGSGPRMWILGGTKRDGRDSLNDVWRSTDETGTKWEQVQPANNKIWSPRHDFGCVVYNKKIWVFGGRGPGGYLNDVWSSPDGTNWTLETNDPGWTPRFAFSAATFILSSPATNQIWIFGGYTKANISDPTNEVYYTNDGVHWSKWTTTAVPWKPRSNPLVQQVGGSLWLTGGTDNGVGDEDPTPWRDVWHISGSEHILWQQFGQDQEAPWTGIGSGVPGVCAEFNGLLWCMGTQKQFGDSLGVWYFLPDR